MGELLSGKGNPNWAGGNVERICIKCGKKFYVIPSRKKARYCSRKCCGMDSARIKMGPRKEVQAKKELEKEGYYVTKSGGSLGAFDLIAINEKIIRAIQIKSTKVNLGLKKYNKDIRKMKEVKLPDNCKREIWIWQYIKGCEKHEI